MQRIEWINSGWHICFPPWYESTFLDFAALNDLWTVSSSLRGPMPSPAFEVKWRYSVVLLVPALQRSYRCRPRGIHACEISLALSRQSFREDGAASGRPP